MKLSELASFLPDASFDFKHNDLEISGVAPLDTAQAGDISFLSSDKYLSLLAQTKASAVIIDLKTTCEGIPSIRTKNPRLVFAQVLNLFYQAMKLPVGIHPTVILADGVVLGERVAIAPYCVIGERVVLGDDVQIFANTVIYDHVNVGDRSVIHSNCVIREYTEIGQDCLIGNGCAIGGDGFGYELDGESWYKIPQTGYVRLGNKVEVGSLTAIDRPAMGITDIGAGTKIDNLVQVGHGVKMGKHCMVVAQVGLAGGVVLGDYVTLAGQVGVGDRAEIGKGAIVGAKSGVISHVEAGATVIGYPSIPQRTWKRIMVAQQQLPDLLKTVHRLEKRIEELESKEHF